MLLLFVARLGSWHFGACIDGGLDRRSSFASRRDRLCGFWVVAERIRRIGGRVVWLAGWLGVVEVGGFGGDGLLDKWDG